MKFYMRSLMMGPMKLIAMLVLPGVAAAMAGCGSSAPAPQPMAPPPMAASPEQAMAAQSEMVKIDPNARVGHVAAFNAQMSMASVADIPVDQVHVGDTIVFEDSRQTPIGNGTVTSIDTTTSAQYPFLIVDYKPNPNGRALIVHDLAIFLPSNH